MKVGKIDDKWELLTKKVMKEDYYNIVLFTIDESYTSKGYSIYKYITSKNRAFFFDPWQN